MWRGITVKEAAKRFFGYHRGSVYNLVAAFRRNPAINFFRDVKRGPKPEPPVPLAEQRRRRILALRKEESLSASEIQQRLAHEGMRVSVSTIARTLKEAGLPRQWRRTRRAVEERRARRVAQTDHRNLNLAPRRFETRFGGLFLFAFDLARLGLSGLVKEVGMPGSERLPVDCAVRSILALKLWGYGPSPSCYARHYG